MIAIPRASFIQMVAGAGGAVIGYSHLAGVGSITPVGTAGGFSGSPRQGGLVNGIIDASGTDFGFSFSVPFSVPADLVKGFFQQVKVNGITYQFLAATSFNGAFFGDSSSWTWTWAGSPAGFANGNTYVVELV